MMYLMSPYIVYDFMGPAVVPVDGAELTFDIIPLIVCKMKNIF